MLDLVDKQAGERKFLKAGSRDPASGLLAQRRCYQFVELVENKENPAGEEELKPIVINGAAIRTPDEDIKWEEEQKELEAQAAKGGKKAPPPKKK